jgi:hypothetical protein
MFGATAYTHLYMPALSIPSNSHPPAPDTIARSWNHARRLQICTYCIFIFILVLRRLKWVRWRHDIDIRLGLPTSISLSVYLSVYSWGTLLYWSLHIKANLGDEMESVVVLAWSCAVEYNDFNNLVTLSRWWLYS